MKVLILGGTGMLGHKLWQRLAARGDTYVTVRGRLPAGLRRFFAAGKVIEGVDAADPAAVRGALERARPDAVVNCIGVVKQLTAAEVPTICISINALFPHLLADWCREREARLICIGTDCVFSGRRGNYLESDASDASDMYGRTKFLGEVAGAGCLTLRTSMVGRELATAHGLIEWFLSRRGESVRGFRKAIFSGLTTLELAGVIERVLSDHPKLAGVYHVAADPIDKCALLGLVRDAYDLPIRIEADDTFVCDRSLNGSRFRDATGYAAAAWPDMIEAMRADPTPYAEVREMLSTERVRRC